VCLFQLTELRQRDLGIRFRNRALLLEEAFRQLRLSEQSSEWESLLEKLPGIDFSPAIANVIARQRKTRGKWEQFRAWILRRNDDVFYLGLYGLIVMIMLASGISRLWHSYKPSTFETKYKLQMHGDRIDVMEKPAQP
jgi:hypothetical protein